MEVTHEFTLVRRHIMKIDDPEGVTIQHVVLCDVKGFESKFVDSPDLMKNLNSTEVVG
jgi:hypothetical protein